MEVMTSQPITGTVHPEHEPTKLRTWALCGAAAGLSVDSALDGHRAELPRCQRRHADLAPWTVGLITYETTMRVPCSQPCGLLASWAADFKSALRPERRRRGVVLAVSCPYASRASVELRSAGRISVNWYNRLFTRIRTYDMRTFIGLTEPCRLSVSRQCLPARHRRPVRSRRRSAASPNRSQRCGALQASVRDVPRRHRHG